MPSVDRRLLVALVLLALSPLLAAARATAGNLIVLEDDVIDEDLIAAATTLSVLGVIEGDLVATTLQTAEIEGVVEGDVQIIASRVEISGRVAGGVRVVADEIEITGSIGDDAVLIGRTVRVSGQMGRDLFVWAGDAVIRGDVGREALVSVLDQAVFGALVDDGGEIVAREIEFERSASFGSGVQARASHIAGAELVDGRVTVPTEAPTLIRVRALLVSVALAGVALMIGLWLSLFWLAPTTVRSSVEVARQQPWRALLNGVGAFGLGSLMLVGPPLAGLLIYPEAALGVYLFGAPLFVLFATLLTVSLFVGAVPAATVIGGRLAPSASPLSAFTVGVFGMSAVLLVPYLRWLVLVPLTAGTGALWLSAVRNRGSIDWLKVQPGGGVGTDGPFGP